MKKNLIALAILSISFTATVQASQHIPSQLDQYDKTGICTNCDLSEARLQSKDNVNLSYSILTRTSLSYNHHYTSNFSHTNFIEADLYGIKASASNFESANLSYASLVSANFSSCDFTNAKLTGADLTNANLINAKITKEQLASAKSIKGAILPDGTKIMK